MDEIQTKVLRVFLLAIHSHIYSFALRFLFLQTHATSFSFCSALLLVKEKGGKPDIKLHPSPMVYEIQGVRKRCRLSWLTTVTNRALVYK